MNDVLVVGSLNVDLTARVDRFPAPGETIHGNDLLRVGGGKGMNQAVAASRVGGNVTLVGMVGSDADGDQLAAWAAEAGIDGEIGRVDGPSGTALITVDARGENQIIVIRGANDALTPEHVRAVIERRRPAVVTFCLEIPPATVNEGMRAARDAGATVLLNPSPLADFDAAVLDACDVLVVNEHELAELVGTAWEDDRDAALTYAARHRLNLVVTRGAHGAVTIGTDGDVAEVPSPRVEAVDTTGCGDAFTGALATALADGKDLAEAARFGCRVAAQAATRRGAQSSYPTLAELG